MPRGFGFAAADARRRELRCQRRRARCGSPDGVSGRARSERAPMIGGLRPRGRRCERRVGSCREARRTVSRTVRRPRSRVARASARHVAGALVSTRPANASAGLLERSTSPGGLRSNRAGRQRQVRFAVPSPVMRARWKHRECTQLVRSIHFQGFVWTHHRSRVAAGVVPNARVIGVAGVRPQDVGGHGVRCSRHAEGAIADGNIREVRSADRVQTFVRNHCRHRFSVSLNASPRA
jgi:hypothetical protein